MVRTRRAIIADKTVVLRVVSALFLDEILAKSALKQSAVEVKTCSGLQPGYGVHSRK